MLIGCHGSVWTGEFDRAGLQLAVDRTAAAGFDLIEVPLLDPERVPGKIVGEMAERAGLAMTASLGLSEATDVSSEDPETVAAGERMLGQCLEFMSDAGGTHLIGVLHSAMRKYMAPPTTLNRQHSVEALGRIADRGRELGVKVAVEVVNRYESYLFNTGRQALEYVEATGSDNLSVHLDTYHMNIEEPDMSTPVLDVGDRLGYIHIGESHRGYLGSGTVDFGTFFRALRRSGFDGPMVFESFSSAIVHPQLSSMLGVWRNLWQDNEDLARHAHSFIHEHLRAVESIRMH